MINTTWTVSLILSSILNQTRMNNISTNTGMKHLFEKDTFRVPKWQERQKIFMITSFLKTTLPIIIPKFWGTKTFYSCITLISIIV